MVATDSTISIEMTQEQIQLMSDSEKIGLLIKIGFINYEAIKRQGELLEGNGKIGLLERVRNQSKQLAWLWVAFTAVASFYGGTLMMHINK